MNKQYRTRDALTNELIDLTVLSRPPRATRRRKKPVGRYTRNDSVKFNTMYMIAGMSTLGLWIALIK